MGISPIPFSSVRDESGYDTRRDRAADAGHDGGSIRFRLCITKKWGQRQEACRRSESLRIS